MACEMLSYSFLSWVRNVDCVRLTANPIAGDFLIRDSADFTVQRNAKREKKGCNLGNPANAFVMATSKQLLVDQAQRLDTGLVEKLVENLFGFFRDGAFEKDRIKVIATVKIIIIERNIKSTHMKRISRVWLAIACQFVPSSAGS